jgi:hypothetical protein
LHRVITRSDWPQGKHSFHRWRSCFIKTKLTEPVRYARRGIIERKHSTGGFVLDDAAGGLSGSHYICSNDFNVLSSILNLGGCLISWLRFKKFDEAIQSQEKLVVCRTCKVTGPRSHVVVLDKTLAPSGSNVFRLQTWTKLQ